MFLSNDEREGHCNNGLMRESLLLQCPFCTHSIISFSAKLRKTIHILRIVW
jgi:hypothetical protein